MKTRELPAYWCCGLCLVKLKLKAPPFDVGGYSISTTFKPDRIELECEICKRYSNNIRAILIKSDR